jgi:hypothetical protein
VAIEVTNIQTPPARSGLSVDVRNYSTNNSVVPVIKYSNADIQKLQIIKENKGKSGVYR